MFEVADYFPELKSKGFTQEIAKLAPIVMSVQTTTPPPPPPKTSKSTTSSPLPSGDASVTPPPQGKRNKREVVSMDYRNNEKFLDAVQRSTSLNQGLSIFETKLDRLVETMGNLRLGNLEGLKRDFFFKTLISDKFNGSEFRIIDVPYFLKTDNKYEFNLNLALFSGITEYKRFHNVQYFNSKLSKEYYSTTDSDELFELDCFAEQLCFPLTTTCSRSLWNSSLHQIMADCPFQTSTLEYELVSGTGILLNKEPINEDIKAFLTEQQLEPVSYPALVETDQCITFHEGQLSMCFQKDKGLIYSKFDSDIYLYLHPMWYSRLLAYFQNAPLMIFLTIVTLTILTMILGVQKTRELILTGKTRFLLYLGKKVRKVEEQRQKEQDEKREQGEGEASAPMMENRSPPPSPKNKGIGKGKSNIFKMASTSRTQ